jgi:hypothetical protein
VGVPLTKLASGIVTGPRPPDLIRAALTDIAAEHGPAVARRMMIGAFTGGAAVVTDLPSMATGAVAAHEKLAAAQEAQATVDAAYYYSCTFHFRCMWEYTTPSHGLPIGAFFRGKSARNAYRRNEDYSITKGNSTVVNGRVHPKPPGRASPHGLLGPCRRRRGGRVVRRVFRS